MLALLRCLLLFSLLIYYFDMPALFFQHRSLSLTPMFGCRECRCFIRYAYAAYDSAIYAMKALMRYAGMRVFIYFTERPARLLPPRVLRRRSAAAAVARCLSF